jgi:predicted RNA-binding Zn-ribbon protein involved in translation (DUF1610 family)
MTDGNLPPIHTIEFQCDKCGHTCMGNEVEHKALRGRHHGHPDDDSQDDCLDVCPECGSVESMREL